MGARKRSTAGSSTRGNFMYEVEEEVPREGRPEALEAVIRAVNREQNEEQVAPEHHNGEQQHELVECAAPAAGVPVGGRRRKDDDVRQVAEMQELRQRHDAETLAH